MKVVLKEKDKIYIQKIDLEYLKEIEENPFFSCYYETCKKLSKEDFVLVEGSSLVSIIRHHEEIMDYLTFLTMSKKRVEELLEEREFVASTHPNEKNLILYQMALLCFKEKDFKESDNFFQLVDSLMDVCYAYVDQNIVTHGTKIEGLYVSRKCGGKHLNLYDEKEKQTLIRQKYRAIGEEGKEEEVKRFSTFDKLSSDEKKLYHILRKKKEKVLRK